MTRSAVLALAVGVTLAPCRGASAQSKSHPLESAAGLRMHNVTAEPAATGGLHFCHHDGTAPPRTSASSTSAPGCPPGCSGSIAVPAASS